MEPLTVDIREAARLTSLSPFTIRAYIKSGRLASVRVGRRVLIEPREIVLLIEKGGRRAPPPKTGREPCCPNGTLRLRLFDNDDWKKNRRGARDERSTERG